jgi:hypothetical protein
VIGTLADRRPEETMKPVAIVTDSCCDLPPELVERMGITVVPLSFTISGRTYRDGEITSAEFYRLMKAAPELPKTSQPPVGAFMDAYRRALESASEVVSVHISSKLSGTWHISSSRTAPSGSRAASRRCTTSPACSSWRPDPSSPHTAATGGA